MIPGKNQWKIVMLPHFLMSWHHKSWHDMNWWEKKEQKSYRSGTKRTEKKNWNLIMQTKAWEFHYHPGNTPMSSLAITCHGQHVKRLFSCPYIPKKEQKPLIARCGKYCGCMGRGAVWYRVMTWWVKSREVRLQVWEFVCATSTAQKGAFQYGCCTYVACAHSFARAF